MNIAELCIRKKTITLVFTALLVVGGVISYGNLPRLEDPEFTIKDAVVVTPYPGATAQEVEEEVTDIVEKAVQQLGQLKWVKSKSERGLSTVQVTIKDKYDKHTLPQVWDELRRKVGDAHRRLPPGAGPSLVNDDFGDVYGIYVAITGDGYSYAELKEYAKLIQRELLLVEDVKKIDLYGVQTEVVYVKMSRQKLAQLGISQEAIFRALAQKNLVADAGDVQVGSEYIPIAPTGTFDSVEKMADLVISQPGADQLIRLGDVAAIERGYRDPATSKLRFDGQAAFAAIGLSQDSTGEYCRSLFVVLLISLMFSWVTAVTMTPLFCVMFLKGKTDGTEDEDPYAGAIFQAYKRVLLKCLRFRWITMGVVAGLLVLSIVGFRFLDQSFFPASTRPQFLIDFWLPQGTHIDQTEKVVQTVEDYLKTEHADQVEHVTTFLGQGGARFLLTYAPEKPDSSYAQLLVEVNDYRVIDELAPQIQDWLDSSFSDAVAMVKKFQLGPGEGGKIQVRLSGPNSTVLRKAADDVMIVMENDASAIGIRSDWRQRTKVVRPVLSETQARQTGINRPRLARALQTAFSGTTAGVYREGDTLLPIIARPPESERGDVDSIKDIQIFSPVAGRTIPIRQVVSRFETTWEDPIIWRRDRIRTITVHCDAGTGVPSALLSRIMPKIEAIGIDLPDGHSIEWGGEYEDSNRARAGLASSIPGFLLLMVLTVIVLFNALRQPAIIWLCVPLAMIGVTFGLLVTGQPFGFMSLLGTLALTGMLIKNSIVLLDQVGLEIASGKPPFEAIVDSGVSRMRPVAMAAATTILGMTPLFLDAFFKAMAVTIMFGLGFATVLTLIVVPVLYAIFFRVPSPAES